MDAPQAGLSVHLYAVSMMELGFQSFVLRLSHRSIPTQRRGSGLLLVIGLSPAHLSCEQAMQPLQIECQTDLTSLARGGPLAAQRELPKSQHLFDHAFHRLDRACAHALDRLPERTLAL